ncbi:MAG: DUF1579 family protein [Planctomycetota bacterium]
MKKTLLATLILTVAGSAVFAATSVWNQEPQMPKPTAQHKALQEGVGNWEGTVTMFMPGVPEMPMPASEVVTAQGPFWVHSYFTTSMGPMGEYNGFGYSGYDPIAKQYVGTWMDNVSTTFSVMKGNYDKQGKVLTMKWKAPDAMGKMTEMYNETVRTKDAYTITFFANGEKNMVIDMKRVEDKAKGKR